MSRFRIPLIVGALLALAACDEAAAPKGTPGNFSVRAYIDRDASGSFTPGDSALEGVVITARASSEGVVSETPISATTNSGGLANFEDMAPGSYVVTLASGAPTGAVLTSNPSPTIGVSFQGTVSRGAEFRFAFEPGSLSGRIYRDDNGNGSYDAGADTPGAGFLVTLRAVENGAPGAVVDTVRADANGAWAFTRLAPGSYFVEFENPGTIEYMGGQSRLVVIAPEVAALQVGVFTGSLVVPIAQARERAVGANVEVIGFITVAPGTFTTGSGSANSEVWVQDASGGIAVLQVPTSLGLTVGQRVNVTGVRFDNALQEQIGSPAAGATITALPGDSVITPQAITVQQAHARTGFEGELVTLSGFTVTTVGGGTDYTVTGAAGDTTIQLRIEGSTGIPSSTFSVGNRYVVTGILTQFNANAQIKPRSVADIRGPTPIATVRAATSGVFTVSGRLTVAPGQIVSGTGGVNSEIWVQDATGGIAVFSVPTANPAGLMLGDVVEVTGTRGAFSNQLQLANPGLTVTRLSAGTPIAPRLVTAAEVGDRTFEGQLVQLAGFTVTTIGSVNANGQFTVTGTAGGRVIQLRVGGAGTGLVPADFTVGGVYTITGVQTISGTTIVFRPRVRGDVVAGIVATPANVIINEFIANPATVNDNAGEYIELYNAGGTEQNLLGWIISDNFGVDTIDTPLVIPAGGYVVLGVNANTATNGGVQVDFQYVNTIALGNSGDRIQLRDPASVTVDSVAYASSAQAQSGVAWGVIDAAVDNANVAGGNWIAQSTVYSAGTTPDRGTPRARNDGATGALRAATSLRSTAPVTSPARGPSSFRR